MPVIDTAESLLSVDSASKVAGDLAVSGSDAARAGSFRAQGTSENVCPTLLEALQKSVLVDLWVELLGTAKTELCWLAAPEKELLDAPGREVPRELNISFKSGIRFLLEVLVTDGASFTGSESLELPDFFWPLAGLLRNVPQISGSLGD